MAARWMTRVVSRTLRVTCSPGSSSSAFWVRESRHESIRRTFQNTGEPGPGPGLGPGPGRGRPGPGPGPGQGPGGPGPGGVLWVAVAFSLFSSDERSEAQKKNDDMMLLLKKAKLSMLRDQVSAASGFLHQAVVLAHQTHNQDAIIYCYSLMANLAYIQGQLDNAEKLFKAAMSVMLSRGTPQDDNAVIEMSLKLATIYAEQNKAELADQGFTFCLDSLKQKLQRMNAEDDVTEEQQVLLKDTRLLLGLSLDSRARYRAATLQLKKARQDYEEALSICRQEQGDRHPQTLVLMSDLASVLDLQGLHSEALVLVQEAVDLSPGSGLQDHHILLGNLAGVLLHTGRIQDSVRVYHQALGLARQAGDQEAVDQIHQGLEEVKKRRKRKEEEEQEQEEENKKEEEEKTEQ